MKNRTKPNINKSNITVNSETLILIDVVDSTTSSNLYGWYSVGRKIFYNLREIIYRVISQYNVGCMKSTGDGYLITLFDKTNSRNSVSKAIQAVLKILKLINKYNQSKKTPEELKIYIRVAVHFGQVDIIKNDREGPDVSYTFRIESISRSSFQEGLNTIKISKFPLKNYIVCSEEIKEIVTSNKLHYKLKKIGLFKLKGFSSWHEIYLFHNNYHIF